MLEKVISQAIFKHFGIENETICDHVKSIDNAILADEANQVMAKPPAKWFLPEPPLGVEIQCWQPDVAAKKFLDRHCHLLGQPGALTPASHTTAGRGLHRAVPRAFRAADG